MVVQFDENSGHPKRVWFKGELCPVCLERLITDIDLAAAVSKLKRSE